MLAACIHNFLIATGDVSAYLLCICALIDVPSCDFEGANIQ